MKKISVLIITIISTFVFAYLFNNRSNYELPEVNIHNSEDKVNKEELYTFNNEEIEYSVNKDYIKDPSVGEYSKIFDKSKIEDVYITVNDNNFKYLLQRANDKPTVLINEIKIGKYNLKYCSMKTKGLTSLRKVYSGTSDKFSFTINFKKYINKKNGYDNQNLLGLSKISFNNMYGDPSMVKDYASYYLFEEMGLDTVNYSYSRLFVNNKYYGIYLMIEPITNALINRTMNEDGDFLFKPDGRMSSLLYDDRLDKYIDKDGNFNFDRILYDKDGKLIYPNNSNNPLNKYSGIWEDDEDNFKDIVDELPTFFKTIKKLNELNNTKNKNTEKYEEELNKIIDVDKLIKYLAVNTYLVNSDGYMSPRSTNYALYMDKNGYITIIPWDYNLSFGGILFDRTEDVINFDIYNPVVECLMINRPLINVILGNKTYLNKYKTYLKDITIIASTGGTTSTGKEYKRDNLKSMIESVRKDLLYYSNKSNVSFYTGEEISIAQDNLIKLIELRSESVIKQINNEESNIYADFDIKSLGGL